MRLSGILFRHVHWGGIWESAIRGAKFHLKRLVGITLFTYKEFSTILCPIKAIINSRPLTHMSNEASDLSCLTPGRFLIGSSLSANPDRMLTTASNNRLSIKNFLKSNSFLATLGRNNC